jgi:hypothetical protein
MSNPYGQHTLINWRRKLALEESKALRALVRLHGHIPRNIRPNRWDIY